MIIQPIRTRRITPQGCTIIQLLDEALTELSERSIVAVAAKAVALCEGRAVPMEGTDKQTLIHQEAEYYLSSSSNPYNVTISITRGNLVGSGGIDESNGDGYYVLWPEDLQASANMMREHLSRKHDLQDMGIIITDSTTRPFQRGTTGLALAYSGFMPLKDYRGTQDIFGRTLQFQQNNLMNGFAAAAVALMGEGNEQTPLAIISDIPGVAFQRRNPTVEELTAMHISLEDDLYAPILRMAPWKEGSGQG